MYADSVNIKTQPAPEENDIERPRSRKCVACIRYTTVEPVMWLYMMAYMITSVVEQAFFVHKACTVDHGFSEEVCRKLKDNTTVKETVQLTVSDFHQWNNIAGHVVPIILAFFFGNWSDRRGRKALLLLGLSGKFLYSFMVVLNSLIGSWNLNMVVYTASLPMGMLGGDVAIFSASFAYISDISSLEDRTMRILILDIVYLSTMPIGVALGSYLYSHVVNSSYSIMFTVNASLLALAIVYAILRLEWQTSVKQQPIGDANVFTDFFDRTHVLATVKTFTKRRAGHAKLYLWLLLLAMALYTFQRDEKPMSYLYTQLKFEWGVEEFSQFRTVQSALFVLAMLIGVPTMSKLMGLRDTVIVAIGSLAHAGGRVIFALAQVPQLFYAGIAVAALGPVVAPAIRAITSKLVEVEERGKVFAILAVCDNAVPLFSGVLYTQLYNATIGSAPSSIYWLTFATQVAVLALISIIHFTAPREHDQPIEE